MWNLPLARGCGLKVFAEGKELPDDDDDVVRRGSNNRKLGFYRAEKGIHSHLPTSEAPCAFDAKGKFVWHRNAFLFREACRKQWLSYELRVPFHREISTCQANPK
jgi:hypothetical protein